MLNAYKRALSVITKKPFRLWGLSLLSGIIMIFAGVLTAPFLTIIGSCFSMVVAAGMAKVYLDALEGKEVNSDQLFEGFKRFWRVLGGLGWKMLWIFIWGAIAVFAAGVVFVLFLLFGLAFGSGAFTVIGAVLGGIVLIAGIVFCIIKSYAYRFVEYILMTEPEVTATEALRKSVAMTKGKKGAMFGADIVFGIATSIIGGIIGLLARIPYVGAIFAIVLVPYYVVLILFSGIFTGLYRASFYLDKPAEATFQQPAQPVYTPAPAADPAPVAEPVDPQTPAGE